MANPLFSPARRGAIAGRAARRGESFLIDAQAEELADRLAMVARSWEDVLLVGTIDRAIDRLGLPGAARVTVMRPGGAAPDRGRWLEAAEDGALPGTAAFDLVLAGGAIDSVNDLPGLLAIARRALRPDSLFLGCLAGAGSLGVLRRMLIRAEGERVRARTHPLVDLRQAGDLLARAGFALPVADMAPLRLGYADPDRLVADLRDAGLTNALEDARAPVPRGAWAAVRKGWAEAAGGDGRLVEDINWLLLTGWSPGPDQPRAARRGSATASLADALRKAERDG